MSNQNQTITVEQQIPLERIASLLTCAFEGGSNYWIDSVVRHNPDKYEFLIYPKDNHAYLCDVALNKGGSVDVVINEPIAENSPTKFTLDFESVKRGLDIFMAGTCWGKDKDGKVKVNKRHAANFINENEDAETGDVFLQTCLFGEVIFG